MSVRCLQEFIHSLSLREASLNSEDLVFLRSFEEKFSSLDLERELSESEINYLETIFARRWHNIIDTKDDYTLLSTTKRDEWVLLGISLSSLTKKPLATILIPGVQAASPELDLNSITDFTDLYIGNDDQTLYSVTSLMQKLQQSTQAFTAHGKFEGGKLITVKELARIRNKQQAASAPAVNSNFWDNFIKEIIPAWQSNSIKSELLLAWCEVIYAFFDCEETNDFTKFKLAFKDFCNYLNSCAAEDINAFYSISFEYEQKTIYLIQILLDCLEMSNDLAKKLYTVLDKIYTLHFPCGLKEKFSERPLHTKYYFEFYNLQELLNSLSIHTQPSFNAKVVLFKNKFLSQKNFNANLLEELTGLLSMNWQEVIHNEDNVYLQNDKNEPTIWHCLIRQFAPAWKDSGQLPEHLLPSLLSLIESYYHWLDSGNKTELNSNLVDFINSLKVSKLEDVNNLYSVIFKLRGKQFYLLELLIELLQGSQRAASKFKIVAQWIYEIDHSLVAKHNQLASVYQNLKAGPYYNISQLRLLINSLSLDSASDLLKLKIENLTQKMLSLEQIDHELIKEISELFASRWLEIIDTSLDYTRLVEGPNKSWIALAQYLEGAGLIDLTPASYYKLLIPSLTHEVDFITREKLTVYPLTHYILSEQGDELVFLPNCVNNFKYRRTFYNCNHTIVKPFTAVEKERIKHSLPQFVHYFNAAEEERHDVPVSRKTVMEVKKLVEGTLYPEGLYLGNDITAPQLQCAENSYRDFLKYLNGLPEEERVRLLNQSILFEGRKVTFLEVLEQVLDKGECLVVNAQYFLKFVLDHDPFMRFPVEWEHKVRVDALRLQSAKKVYSDYDQISFEEAIKRILILCVSVMTHTFKYLPLTGVSLTLWDCANTITKTGSDIMQLIKKAIMTGNFSQARFIYASLLESIIKPAFVNDGYRVALLRYPDTIAWLGKIIDESLFKQATITCFEPDTLLTVLWSYKEKNNRITPQMELFLEEIILTLLQEQNDYLKWIRINIKFSEFLRDISKEEGEEILGQLRLKVEPIPPATLVKIISEFLIHRVASQIARPSKSFVLFKDTSVNSNLYQEVVKRLQQELEAFHLSEQEWYQLPTILEKIAKTTLVNYEISMLPKYFNKFTANIPFLENSQDNDEFYFSSSALPAAM
ncbi:hypothetical protein [Legionella beliardensis]|nr:hypothetical protein [Legionella beliardensis]